MKDTKITDAIVPIYCDNAFGGTGFIYKSYLITAAHVVDKSKDICFVYRGNIYKVQEGDRLYCKIYGKERDEYGRMIFNALTEDLAIYTIGLYSSAFALSKEIVRDGTNASLFGYHYENNASIPLRNGIVELLNDSRIDRVSFFPQDYCMYCRRLDNNFDVIKGYSGGPIVIGNTIVGMLIEKMTIAGYYHIMKANRIFEILSANNPYNN